MNKKNYKFVEKKNLWFFISVLVIIMGFGLMCLKAFQGKPILNYGIDFIGGNTMLLKLDDNTDLKTQSLRLVRHFQYLI